MNIHEPFILSNLSRDACHPNLCQVSEKPDVLLLQVEALKAERQDKSQAIGILVTARA